MSSTAILGPWKEKPASVPPGYDLVKTGPLNPVWHGWWIAVPSAPAAQKAAVQQAVQAANLENAAAAANAAQLAAQAVAQAAKNAAAATAAAAAQLAAKQQAANRVALTPAAPPAPTTVKQLGASDAASLAQWGAFWNALLVRLGAPITDINLAALSAWARAEGMRQSTWNPLATTEPFPGAVPLAGNPDGVKSYPDSGAGVEATARTLLLPAYVKVVAALRKGNSIASIWAAVNASPWCAGCDGGDYPATVKALIDQGISGAPAAAPIPAPPQAFDYQEVTLTPGVEGAWERLAITLAQDTRANLSAAVSATNRAIAVAGGPAPRVISPQLTPPADVKAMFDSARQASDAAFAASAAAAARARGTGATRSDTQIAAGSALPPPPPPPKAGKGKVVNPLGEASWSNLGGPGVGTHAYVRNWQSSQAQDMGVPVGTPVYAPVPGTIVRAKTEDTKNGPEGIEVGIDGGGTGRSAFLGHLSRVARGITVGRVVKAGDYIGESGNAAGVAVAHTDGPWSLTVDPYPPSPLGAHLHFALTVPGQRYDDSTITKGVDPASLL